MRIAGIIIVKHPAVKPVLGGFILQHEGILSDAIKLNPYGYNAHSTNRHLLVSLRE